MTRVDGRRLDDLRKIKIETDVNKHAEGSVLISAGDTQVLCTASVENRVPPWLKGSGQGWVTAEYAMLPRATTERQQREATRGRQGGRTMEIQRLIGRALRSVIRLDKLGERTLWIDCDVLVADGGTRTTAITGSFLALALALKRMQSDSSPLPLVDFVAATSVGLVDDQPMLDLCYEEDSRAGVDVNVVMTGQGQLVEVQGAAEGRPFSRIQMDALLDLATTGINHLVAVQAQILGDIKFTAEDKKS